MACACVMNTFSREETDGLGGSVDRRGETSLLL